MLTVPRPIWQMASPEAGREESKRVRQWKSNPIQHEDWRGG